MRSPDGSDATPWSGDVDVAGIAYALVLPALCAPLLLCTRWTYRPGSLLLRGVLAALLVRERNVHAHLLPTSTVSQEVR